MEQRLIPALTILVTLLILGACGTNNLFKDAEKDDVAEDAAIELEKGEPEKAIKMIEKALQHAPNDYPLISLLSAAYAQRGGISIIDLASNMVDHADNGSESQNSITALWPLLPEPSVQNLSDVRKGVTLLRSIPSSQRTDADSFKLAVLSTALASMQLKAFDKNGDGTLSIQELSNLSGASADTILAALLGASGALKNMSGVSGESTQTAARQIDAIVSEVQSSPGSDNIERISNYFD
jgi:hypothetical protein